MDAQPAQVSYANKFVEFTEAVSAVSTATRGLMGCVPEELEMRRESLHAATMKCLRMYNDELTKIQLIEEILKGVKTPSV